MDWLPTYFDPLFVFTWCLLNKGDFARPIANVVGFGGLFLVLKSLYGLPPRDNSTIVTIRDERRRYRKVTVTVGVCALLLFCASIAIYLAYLQHLGKECDRPDDIMHETIIVIAPYIITTVVAVLLYVCLVMRIRHLKNP
jgi:drug/metabolite transporter (DMT)-like permease